MCNYAEIYSFLMREGGASSRLCRSFLFISHFFRTLWRHTTNLVVPKLRSTAQLLLQPLVGVAASTKTAPQKKKSSMPNAVLQECVPSTFD